MQSGVGGGGALVVSLDFELMWGVRDKRSVENYGKNVLGVRQAVPALLKLFSERRIGCTWATVGLLLFDNKRDLMNALPARRPRYADSALSPYADIEALGADEASDPYHYGLSLVRRIQDVPGQEIATHTLSHFYCQEDGADLASFEADLDAAITAAGRLGIEFSSIAFPRNQMSLRHLQICRDAGLRAYRGNEAAWFHRACSQGEQSLAMRGMRLADSYFPIAGAHDSAPEIVEGLVNIPSSRFLRPARADGIGESWRLKRIASAMEQAARRGTIFHLWWHPHNFGVNLPQNMAFLTAILDHFQGLQHRYGMRSMTMAAVADEVLLDAGQDRRTADIGRPLGPDRRRVSRLEVSGTAGDR